MNEDFRMEQGYKEAAYGDSLGRYTAKTFGWMFIGLLITFGVAIGMYMTDGLYYVSRVPGWYYILFIAEIGIVVYLSARINQMTVGMARTMFFLYAAVNGIVFSMYFSGGMIPHYLVVKGVGLNNRIWALIIPSAISTYNLIIMRTAMVSVPDSLEESAKLDGANQWTILWKIMVPLVKPTIAVICLYYAVTHWNSWFNAMLFIRNKSGYPLQLVLREILLQNDTTAMTAGAEDYMISETIQFATIVVATVPILAIYPFIQRYFVKGVMIGAVKG